MGMTWSVTKPALLRKLKRWGGFQSEASLARFYEAVISACTKIRRKGEWPWKIDHADIVTTEGNLGPYDAPENFYRMAMERKVYKYGFTDTNGQVIAPILQTDSSDWDATYRVTDQKLYFRDNPGSGTISFNFIGTVDNDPTDASAQLMVEAMSGSLFDVLADFVEADFLGESPDTKADGIAKLNEAMVNLDLEYNEQEKGRARQRQRSPRGMDGRPFDGLARQASIQKANRSRWPRGGNVQ